MNPWYGYEIVFYEMKNDKNTHKYDVGGEVRYTIFKGMGGS